MDHLKEGYEKLAMCTLPLFIVGISGFLLGMFATIMHSMIFRWLGIDRNDISCSQKDIAILKKTSLLIAQEWIEMTKLIKGVRDAQAGVVDHFQLEFQFLCEELTQKILVRLKEEGFVPHVHGDLARLKGAVDNMREDVAAVKICLRSLVKKSELAEDRKSSRVDSASRTLDDEKRKKMKNLKNKVIPEDEASKFIASVKKCLTDIMKNTKLQLEIDQEEHNKELEFIFAKLAEDREDIKKTIEKAFTIVAEQVKRNYDQFRHHGQDALHYIAVLNENTNNVLKTKLKDADGRLKEILNAAKQQNFDVASVAKVLENVHGQLDDMIQRVEQGCQKNTEHCEEMAGSLEIASHNWISTASELEKFAGEFSGDAEALKEMLAEMKNLVDGEDPEGILKGEKGTANSCRALVSASLREAYLSKMYTCWERLSTMHDRVEEGCQEICGIVDSLKGRLHSLSEPLAELEDFLRKRGLENLLGFIMSPAKGHANSNREGVPGTLPETYTGDALPHIFQPMNTADEPTIGTTRGPKSQNTVAVDTGVKRSSDHSEKRLRRCNRMETK